MPKNRDAQAIRIWLSTCADVNGDEAMELPRVIVSRMYTSCPRKGEARRRGGILESRSREGFNLRLRCKAQLMSELLQPLNVFSTGRSDNGRTAPRAGILRRAVYSTLRRARLQRQADVQAPACFWSRAFRRPRGREMHQIIPRTCRPVGNKYASDRTRPRLKLFGSGDRTWPQLGHVLGDITSSLSTDSNVYHG